MDGQPLFHWSFSINRLAPESVVAPKYRGDFRSAEGNEDQGQIGKPAADRDPQLPGLEQ